MGIVHHSNFIRWLEEARLDLMEQRGLNYARMEEEGVVSPILDVHCAYRSMVRFGESLVITARVTAFNGAKLCLSYEIRDVESGELKAEAESKHCFLEKASGRLLSLKKSRPEMYRALSALL